MPFAYYDKLPKGAQAVYDRSDAITAVKLPLPHRARSWIPTVRECLDEGDSRELERALRGLLNEIAIQLGAPPLKVRVRSRRPVADDGELHGLYEPTEGRARATVTVWMRTAAKGQIVAFKSFLRTALHELVHHLDYELFGLAETFHTEGFYKRESSLFHQLVPKDRRARPARRF